MKTVNIQIVGTQTKVYVDNVEVEYLREFRIEGGVDKMTSIELSQYLVDSTED